MQNEDTLFPTDYMESIMLTSVIYAKEDRYVATTYILNLFIHKPINNKIGEETY